MPKIFSYSGLSKRLYGPAAVRWQLVQVVLQTVEGLNALRRHVRAVALLGTATILPCPDYRTAPCARAEWANGSALRATRARRLNVVMDIS